MQRALDDQSVLLRLLVVDEDPEDGSLLAASLEGSGRKISWRRVATAAGLIDALGSGRWDAVLVDRGSRAVDWRTALELASTRIPGVPVIIVADEGTPALASEAIRGGAADYVLRGQLWRLAPALEREIARAATLADARNEHEEYDLLKRELNTLGRQTSLLVWSTDPQLRITRFWDPLGETSAVGRLVGDIGIGEPGELANAHRTALESGRATFEISSHGRTYRCEVDATPRSGPVRGLIGVAVDVTELREVEGELRDSEARLRTIVESALDMVVVIDADEQIVFSNPAAARMLGYRDEELLNTNAFAHVHPDDVPYARSTFGAVLRGDTSGSFELRLRSANGSFQVVEAVAQRVATRAVDGVLVVARDVTDRRRLETQLQRTEQLELIGQLAGGVAHDFNNVLQVIRGYASLLLASDDHGSDGAHKGLTEILGAADRAGVLVRQLLAIGRRQVLASKPVGLGEVVAGFEQLLRQALPAKVNLQLEVGDSPVVVCDPTQIERVVLNLVVNARDAIADRGDVVVRTSTVELDVAEAAALQPALPPGRFGTLSVRDTGCGIPADVLPRLFEAFFTTKAEHGTGLGLSAAYGIVSQSGGAISVETSPGAGSTFTIYLPLAGAPASSPPRADAPELEREEQESGGRVKILLVEDEEPTRPLLQRMLESFGYEASAAADGEEALRLAAGRDFDLLITDIVMPGMNGYELAERFEHEHRGTPTLFITGSPLVDGAPPDAGLRTLQKPFGAEDLQRRIHETLGTAQ